jgi:hypothetical protein
MPNYPRDTHVTHHSNKEMKSRLGNAVRYEKWVGGTVGICHLVRYSRSGPGEETDIGIRGYGSGVRGPPARHDRNRGHTSHATFFFCLLPNDSKRQR